MALSANAAVQRMPAGLVEYPVEGDAVVFQGAMIGLASGYARPLQAADTFAGIAYEAADNSGGAGGGQKVRVQLSGVFRLSGSGFSQASVGAVMYASDDGTVTATSSGNSRIGRCVKFESSTVIWVKIEP